MNDEDFMRRALELARAQAGRTAPNPAVGCVLVRGDTVIGEGATADGGAPHAEESALQGVDARGATAYVTLEPCAQRSKGGKACAVMLAEAGVARVVFACLDPHPNGAGLETLENAGIAVTVGVLAKEARALNADFFAAWDNARPSP